MTIKVDETKLAEKLNAELDVPFLPESAERNAFRLGVEAATKLFQNVTANVNVLADYGITVTDE